ncbi:MAG: prepilin peptidase [Thermoleophilia bacterium]|nr:prepilin peptidase [Thermoleophilia bacterium]
MEIPVVIFVTLFGLVFGSFLNVVIARLPAEEPADRSLNGRSRCPKCRAPIAGYDNIPLFSWLILRGKCRKCKAPISFRYPLVELLTAMLWGGVAYASDDWRTVVPGLVFMSLLVPLTFIDFDLRILPNRLTYPGTLVGLALSIGLGPQPRFRAHDLWWLEVLIATFAASGFLLIAALIRPGGMGLGDVKLAAMMGAFLGSSVAVAMMAGFISALIPSLVLFAIHGVKARKMAIPFGPFLAMGSVIAWFWGPQLVDAYLRVGR